MGCTAEGGTGVMNREILRQALYNGDAAIPEWNRWRESRENSEKPLDLNEADFRNLDLSDLGLNGANFSRLDMSGADLSGADLSGADLRGASLTRANLRYANLSDADLRGANLSETKLEGATFRRVRCGGTTFADNDLERVEDLGSVEHFGPSTIGIDTLFRSGRKIPEAFLRGCGVPHALITYLTSLIGSLSPIQFYYCFIIYSTKDDEFAKRLYSKMRDEGFRVWLAPEGVQWGKPHHEQIDDAINMYDKLLLVLSPNSMTSKWVKTEIRKARSALGARRRKLFPIRLVNFETVRDWECFDADRGNDLGVEIREYFIPDFSNWKNHDSFEGAFVRLLNDLKAEQSMG
jgi:hypothetical protein